MLIPNSSECLDLEANRQNGNFMCGVVEGFYGRPWTTEQRKRLFQRMRKMGMNTYLYAPKDDCKHRMYWRDLYTVEEADHLTTLISAADEEDISFVYALSPGLDMTYSSPKELACLKRKLEQVSNFGCKAFALLFDDIDVEMCEADKEIFQSFAQAQVSVTNEVYQHLSQPANFLFCPTEYCATRAVPAVSNSEYLGTIGAKLLQGIDVMWTGPKVISKRISIKSIEEIAKVLQRPPVIWDNIHANDYDQRRLFLGPYDGRSTELIPYLKGVLTNPNCEFEANYVAFHTLSQWSKSNVGGARKDFILSESPVTADIKLETEGEYTTDEDVSLNTPSVYQPRLALKEAIVDWMSELYSEVTPVVHKMPMVPPPLSLPTASLGVTCSTMTGTTMTAVGGEVNDSYMQPTGSGPVNSLIGPLSSSSDSDADSGVDIMPEPMDCASSVSGVSTCSNALSEVDSVFCEPKAPSLSCLTDPLSAALLDTCSCPSSDKDTAVEGMQVDCDSIGPLSPVHYTTKSSPIPVPSPSNPPQHTDCCSPPPEPMAPEGPRLTLQDMETLVEMFYMPFEHGSCATHLLNELHWLKTSTPSAGATTRAKAALKPTPGSTTQEWHERATAFCQHLQNVFDIFTRICSIPNKAMLYDLFPYIWDMSVVLNQLQTFIGWLALGVSPEGSAERLQGNPYSWSSVQFREHFASGQQEPWVFRGGVQAEFQRMLPLEGAADLLLLMCPQTPELKLNKVRPYKFHDETSIYEVCRKTCDDCLDGTDIFPEQPDLIGDKLVGNFLMASPEYCFVVEDNEGVCGYVLATPSAADHHRKMEMAWLPAMREKYPRSEKEDQLSPAEELISSFHSPQRLPSSLTDRFPALVRMDMLPDRMQDTTAAKRALAGVVSALKVSNIHGMHAQIHVGDHNTVEFYTKLGFFDIPLPDVPDDMIYMGRMF